MCVCLPLLNHPAALMTAHVTEKQQKKSFSLNNTVLEIYGIKEHKYPKKCQEAIPGISISVSNTLTQTVPFKLLQCT